MPPGLSKVKLDIQVDDSDTERQMLSPLDSHLALGDHYIAYPAHFTAPDRHGKRRESVGGHLLEHVSDNLLAKNFNGSCPMDAFHHYHLSGDNSLASRSIVSFEHDVSPLTEFSQPVIHEADNFSQNDVFAVTIPFAKGQSVSYALGRLIGKGSYGTVFEAKVLNKSRADQPDHVAIKFISKRRMRQDYWFAERIRQEVKIMKHLGNLNDPLLCGALAVWQSDDWIYIAMKTTLDIFKLFSFELLAAVKALHQQNIVHGDIKPDNILVTRDGHIVLADFTNSEFFEDAPPGSLDYPLPGRTMPTYGTSEYAAPELLRHFAYHKDAAYYYEGISTKVDVWSAGITLAEFATNRVQYITNNDSIGCARELLTYMSTWCLEQDVKHKDLPEGAPYSLQHLLVRLVTKDPVERISVSAALKNTFFDQVRKELVYAHKLDMQNEQSNVDTVLSSTEQYTNFAERGSQQAFEAWRTARIAEAAPQEAEKDETTHSEAEMWAPFHRWLSEKASLEGIVHQVAHIYGTGHAASDRQLKAWYHEDV
ncbi:kinase-like domain-containing protein [Vararia minispora EC-137]|uniref:Kinase-like domain-containing protein n=1 Tax=Vararia minispora EC-137 TaxID=1314806 RepID=A0ACB8QUD2_9AGAM|nr:kinase-like domain-containing protein [Vararia minispora EC-137]